MAVQEGLLEVGVVGMGDKEELTRREGGVRVSCLG